ncbi:MAG: GNAT family N-acetyltransferase [Gaiellaceae bacterium]
MNVRRATADDVPTVKELVHAMTDELWDRPFQPIDVPDGYFDDKVILLAEDDREVIGVAFGHTLPNRVAHLNVIYVRPDRRRQGLANELLREFVAVVREQGAEHVALDVDTTNEVGRAVWQRLGFTEWARRLATPVDELERRLGGEAGESYGSIHVQTEDAAAVEAAVRKYVPRIGRFDEIAVEAARNGWTLVYGDIGREPQALRHLAQELSYATGAVVFAIGVEDGAVVRYLLYERGSIIDEYLSVPEYYGALPPGDVIALAANPTVVARLTGADPARVRAVARTAASPDELPPAPELLAQIAEVVGLTIQP